MLRRDRWRRGPRTFVLSATAIAVLSFTAVAFAAGQDSWGCYSTRGVACYDQYSHHFAEIRAQYCGTSPLYMEAKDFAVQGSAQFYADGYADDCPYTEVAACATSDCVTDANWLGYGDVENLNSSQHNILGYGDFY